MALRRGCRMAASHTRPRLSALFCLCSCSCWPHPGLPAWGGGRKSHAGGAAATRPNQKFHTPIRTGPCAKPARSWGKAQSWLCSRPLMAGAPAGQSSEGRAQTRPSQASSSPESCSPPAGGPAQGWPAGPERASESPPPPGPFPGLISAGEVVASRHTSLQQAVILVRLSMAALGDLNLRGL